MDELSMMNEEVGKVKEKMHELSNEITTVKLSHANSQKEVCTEIAVLREKVTGWLETTAEYRTSLCSKLDKIYERLEGLPCKERQGYTDSIKTQMRWMWACTGGVLLAIIGDWVSKVNK